MRRPTNYLLLDKDDITKVCGIMSSKEILKEISNSRLVAILQNEHEYFRDKYVLVEEVFKENKHDITDVKVDESKKKYYYANINGQFYSIDKRSNKRKELTLFIGRYGVDVKINHVLYNAKNLMAETFFRGYNARDFVITKDNNPFNISLKNLAIIDSNTYSKYAKGFNRQRTVALYENNKMIKAWNSANSCAKELFVSPQTVLNYCNNKTPIKKRMYDLRWI